MENKEIRNISNKIKRSGEDSRLVEGVAVVFDTDSQDLGFVERISPNAITQETIENSDIFAYLNHDSSKGVLARSRYGFGSLTLSLDGKGLHYSFEAPKTQLGDELLSYLSRGEINTSSFAFSVADGGDKWQRDTNGKLHREITKIERLYDVSPVFQPAYLETSVSRRKLDDIKVIDDKLDTLRKEIDEL